MKEPTQFKNMENESLLLLCRQIGAEFQPMSLMGGKYLMITASIHRRDEILSRVLKQITGKQAMGIKGMWRKYFSHITRVTLRTEGAQLLLVKPLEMGTVDLSPEAHSFFQSISHRSPMWDSAMFVMVIGEDWLQSNQSSKNTHPQAQVGCVMAFD